MWLELELVINIISVFRSIEMHSLSHPTKGHRSGKGKKFKNQIAFFFLFFYRIFAHHLYQYLFIGCSIDFNFLTMECSNSVNCCVCVCLRARFGLKDSIARENYSCWWPIRWFFFFICHFYFRVFCSVSHISFPLMLL